MGRVASPCSPPVDLAALERWMDQRGLGSGPLRQVATVGGGTQNVLLRFERAGRGYLLRRPALRKRPNSDDTMRREARLLAALAGTDVPHPGLIAACADERPLGAAFYLMEPVDGFNPVADLPDHVAACPTLCHRMGLVVVDALAALGRVDHVALGLADFGRPTGWLERQVERWRGQLGGYQGVPGYPSGALAGTGAVERWLNANLPVSWRPGLLHGDFHLGNVLIAEDASAVVAIVDWELATIGDPLLDLGHLLVTWPAGDGPGACWARVPGLPTREEVLARYREVGDRPVVDIRFYEVLAAFRLAVLLEGTHVRSLEGKVDRSVGDEFHAIARSLVGHAESLCR